MIGLDAAAVPAPLSVLQLLQLFFKHGFSCLCSFLLGQTVLFLIFPETPNPLITAIIIIVGILDFFLLVIVNLLNLMAYTAMITGRILCCIAAFMLRKRLAFSNVHLTMLALLPLACAATALDISPKPPTETLFAHPIYRAAQCFLLLCLLGFVTRMLAGRLGRMVQSLFAALSVLALAPTTAAANPDDSPASVPHTQDHYGRVNAAGCVLVGSCLLYFGCLIITEYASSFIGRLLRRSYDNLCHFCRRGANAGTITLMIALAISSSVLTSAAYVGPQLTVTPHFVFKEHPVPISSNTGSIMLQAELDYSDIKDTYQAYLHSSQQLQLLCHHARADTGLTIAPRHVDKHLTSAHRRCTEHHEIPLVASDQDRDLIKLYMLGAGIDTLLSPYRTYINAGINSLDRSKKLNVQSGLNPEDATTLDIIVAPNTMDVHPYQAYPWAGAHIYEGPANLHYHLLFREANDVLRPITPEDTAGMDTTELLLKLDHHYPAASPNGNNTILCNQNLSLELQQASIHVPNMVPTFCDTDEAPLKATKEKLTELISNLVPRNTSYQDALAKYKEDLHHHGEVHYTHNFTTTRHKRLVSFLSSTAYTEWRLSILAANHKVIIDDVRDRINKLADAQDHIIQDIGQLQLSIGDIQHQLRMAQDFLLQDHLRQDVLIRRFHSHHNYANIRIKQEALLSRLLADINVFHDIIANARNNVAHPTLLSSHAVRKWKDTLRQRDRLLILEPQYVRAYITLGATDKVRIHLVCPTIQATNNLRLIWTEGIPTPSCTTTGCFFYTPTSAKPFLIDEENKLYRHITNDEYYQCKEDPIYCPAAKRGFHSLPNPNHPLAQAGKHCLIMAYVRRYDQDNIWKRFCHLLRAQTDTKTDIFVTNIQSALIISALTDVTIESTAHKALVPANTIRAISNPPTARRLHISQAGAAHPSMVIHLSPTRDLEALLETQFNPFTVSGWATSNYQPSYHHINSSAIKHLNDHLFNITEDLSNYIIIDARQPFDQTPNITLYEPYTGITTIVSAATNWVVNAAQSIYDWIMSGFNWIVQLIIILAVTLIIIAIAYCSAPLMMNYCKPKDINAKGPSDAPPPPPKKTPPPTPPTSPPPPDDSDFEADNHYDTDDEAPTRRQKNPLLNLKPSSGHYWDGPYTFKVNDPSSQYLPPTYTHPHLHLRHRQPSPSTSTVNSVLSGSRALSQPSTSAAGLMERNQPTDGSIPTELTVEKALDQLKELQRMSDALDIDEED